ncbi:DUF937 domain-containing protein [Roseibium salinum]|uniref:DUF937 domain-containing protein n=1 Tax=Roseibium salinum TaxID=1604349 RepID=A0ABT3R3S5_9HYPH|nr:DUF937 domain-containing protein [Roseibium sp. DSM 29163]MCX2723912.1 hypothetical protein [Roseibium sp. DSM 29163]MDN3718284.1 hypothetical protein [Roseibium salinum]
MTGNDKAAPPFDIFTVMEDVRERFGWSDTDLSRVMEQLMPAAFNGFRHFGGAIPGFNEFLSQSSPQAAAEQNPFAGYTRLFQSPSDAALTPFFGPEAVQQAVAAQVSAFTGLQRDAIQEMMPVAATLAMGQIARPFVHGEARNLLDAYLRGFARGRPKPQPTPVDYLQGYADAMQSFWGAFLQPASIVPDSAEPEEEPGPEPEVKVTPEEDELPPAEQAAGDKTSEFDEMVSGWMEAGRDFQSSQFKAFDSFFERAARDYRNP